MPKANRVRATDVRFQPAEVVVVVPSRMVSGGREKGARTDRPPAVVVGVTADPHTRLREASSSPSAGCTWDVGGTQKSP